MTSIGIAVASGTLKGVFAHGVLAGLEHAGVRADVYGGVSSSTLSIGLAACGRAEEVGVDYWLRAREWAIEHTGDMSRVVQNTIANYGPMIREGVFAANSPQVGVLTTHVRTSEATAITQSDLARRFGRKLLVMLFKGNTDWIDNNTTARMFWNDAESAWPLTDENFDAVAYASTRMMHAWPQPAWVANEPYIDGSYQKLIPDDEVRERCDVLIAVGSEAKMVLRTFDGTVVETNEDTITVCPDAPLEKIGVEFEKATDEGLRTAYRQGFDRGQAIEAALAERTS